MFNFINMLNEYLANIYVLKTNLENLYFNGIGKEDSITKKMILKDIKIIYNIYIKLALIIKKMGGYPLTDLIEIKKISKIKQIKYKNYTPKEINIILLDNYTTINNINSKVGEYAINNYNIGSINLTLEINQYLQEKIIMLKTINN